jgi:hypothetical protein
MAFGYGEYGVQGVLDLIDWCMLSICLSSSMRVRYQLLLQRLAFNIRLRLDSFALKRLYTAQR